MKDRSKSSGWWRLAAGLVAVAAAVACGSNPAEPSSPAVAVAFASTDLRTGSGTEATNGRTVTVHYTGWTTDGKPFDSSVTRGEPITFPLSNVIPGWTEGVQLMVEGEKRRFWIPAKLAYEGQQGPQGMLVFDVELIAIK